MKPYLIKRNSYFSENSCMKKGDNKNKNYIEKKYPYQQEIGSFLKKDIFIKASHK